MWENGAILANAPDPAAAEEAVDYALLEHAAPRRVLLIGGGENGAVGEALQHPTIERLDYVELDPALIGMARQFFPAQTAAFDSGPRVRLHFLDGRRYLAESNEEFDVIIVDVPDPQTAQLNRFYTAEFFGMARAHLSPSGLLALELRSQEEAISPDLADFLRSIRRTLGEVFPYQVAIPGETIHFFGAMQAGVLTRNPDVLVTRLRARRLHTQYVREYFIPYRMMPDRMEQVDRELQPVASTQANRDFEPVAYGFDLLLWSGQFKSGYSGWFRAAEHVPFRRVASGVGLLLALAVALLAFVPRRERRARLAAGSCVAATGFTLMALQFSSARVSGGLRVCLRGDGDSDWSLHGGDRVGKPARDAPWPRAALEDNRRVAAFARHRGPGAAAAGSPGRGPSIPSGVGYGAARFSGVGGACRHAGRISICPRRRNLSAWPR